MKNHYSIKIKIKPKSPKPKQINVTVCPYLKVEIRNGIGPVFRVPVPVIVPIPAGDLIGDPIGSPRFPRSPLGNPLRKKFTVTRWFPPNPIQTRTETEKTQFPKHKLNE